MSGYRPGYSESHSPFWLAGLADGRYDARATPPNQHGPDPEKSWSAMYMRGYRVGFYRTKAAKESVSRANYPC